MLFHSCVNSKTNFSFQRIFCDGIANINPLVISNRPILTLLLLFFNKRKLKYIRQHNLTDWFWNLIKVLPVKVSSGCRSHWIENRFLFNAFSVYDYFVIFYWNLPKWLQQIQLLKKGFVRGLDASSNAGYSLFCAKFGKKNFSFCF